LKLGKRKIGVIFNLDKMEESGSHWVSLFIDLQDEFIFYFDSNGDKIPKEIKVFVDRIKSYCGQLHSPIHLQEYNNYKVQHQYENTECGMYSLFFIITMLSGKINNVPVESYEEKIQLFREPRIPDKYVSDFRKIYFKV
jgi:Ulp1 family protease